MPNRMCIAIVGDHPMPSSNGNGSHAMMEGTLETTPGPTPHLHATHLDSRSPSLGASALTPHRFSPASDGMHLPPTPSINGVHGMNGFGSLNGWTLASPAIAMPVYGNVSMSRSSTPPPMSLYGPSPTGALERSASSLACQTSQRYSHDPYSLNASQRVSAPSPRGSHAIPTPADVSLRLPDASGPLGPHPLHPNNGPHPNNGHRREAARPRRRHRQGEHARHAKVLPDTAPPTAMRYLPPPPPNAEGVADGLVTAEALQRMAQRWYERTLAAEGNYAWRIPAPVWFQPLAASQPAFVAKQTMLCPRVEFYPHAYWQWLAEAERWWETSIRPLTGAPLPPPPPYN